MKYLYTLVAFVLLALAPCAALSQTTPLPLSMIGVGTHGFDFAIGTWSCTNSMSSGGPATFSSIIGRTSVDGVLSFHSTAKNLDYTGYLFYDPKTKIWWNPITYTNADYTAESSRGSGQEMVFEGPLFAAARKFATQQVRDALTFVSTTKYTDVGGMLTGDRWKTSWKFTCTKS